MKLLFDEDLFDETLIQSPLCIALPKIPSTDSLLVCPRLFSGNGLGCSEPAVIVGSMEWI